MRARLVLSACLVLVVAACGEEGAAFETAPSEARSTTSLRAEARMLGDEPPPVSSPIETATTLAVRGCLNPETMPYRGRWSEIADGYHTEVRREIIADEGHWVFDDLEGEDRIRSTVVIDGTTWELDKDGSWTEFPIVPLRFPLLVWVNGYVTGGGVAGGFEPAERGEVAGIPATLYVGGVEEMTRAFPGKMRDREFEPTTEYRYWVDDCGELLKADVRIDLGGEERQIALGHRAAHGLPLRICGFRYRGRFRYP